jgi:rRNA processing protein Gar1
MKRTWIYLINPILTATEENYVNAIRLSVFHLAALQANQSDPNVAAMLLAYLPLHNALIGAYNAWRLQGGSQISDTLALNTLYAQLSGKIKTWDVYIQTKYPEGTKEYAKLLPHHRIPFQTGAQFSKLTALENLNELVNADATLVFIKPDVNALYAALNAAYSHQKTSKGTTTIDSAAIEIARVNMCVAQYANLGGLIQRHSARPEDVEKFFDLEHIRRNTQDVFTHIVDANTIYCIVKRTLKGDAVIEITNSGVVVLVFYLADSKKGDVGATFVSVPPEKTVTIVASQLGDVANPFVMVKNTDDISEGSFEMYFK